MRQAIVSVLIGAAALLAPLAANAQHEPAGAPHSSHERYKVVIQVSDADPTKWNLALNNARNIQQDLGNGNVEIEIVAYGPGLAMLKSDSRVADRLGEALDNSIALLACENTMRNAKVTKAEMYSGIGYVGAGVVHIMKREREGWQYIRP